LLGLWPKTLKILILILQSVLSESS